MDIVDKGMAGKLFHSSIDGHMHKVNERGAKIIEVLYNG